MTTTFFFHATASPVAGTLPSTTQSGLTVTGSGGDAQTVNRSMDINIGASQTSIVKTSAANTSANHYYFTRFVSHPLSATTINSGSSSWSYNFAAQESNANANFPVTTSSVISSICCYMWRPSTGTRVGFILNGSSSSSYAEATTSESALSGTFSGASVVIQTGDVLCMEIIFTTTQGSSSNFTQTFYYDGTTTSSTSSNAAFLSTTQNLNFAYVVPIVDSVSVSEHLTVAKFIAMFDTLQKKVAKKMPAEAALSVTDTISASKFVHRFPRSISDTVATITDAVTRVRTVPIINTDLLSLTEAVQKFVLHKKTDSITITADSLKKSKAMSPFVDLVPISVSDALQKKYHGKITEALGVVSDPIFKSRHQFKAVADVLSFTDALKKKALKPFSDIAAASEVLVKKALHKLTTEAVGAITETRTRNLLRSLIQTTGAITDSVKKKALHQIPDSISVSDLASLPRGILRKLATDSITVSDSLQKTHRFVRLLAQAVRTMISGIGV
jgi:hypothetical protein